MNLVQRSPEELKEDDREESKNGSEERYETEGRFDIENKCSSEG
jgi:hypothetical protein